MTKQELFYDSRDNESRIHAVRWIPEKKPVLILQIVHGMCEYIERYAPFAEYLAGKGILVCGEDHLGHGKSVGDNPVYGYFCRKDPATVVVRDVHRLKKMTQQEYPGVPYVILGHSMGSFIARNYMYRYGSGVDAMIIMGTGMVPLGTAKLLKTMAGILSLFQGDKHKSTFLNNLSSAEYFKKIPNHTSPFDWLSRNPENVRKYEEDPLCGFTFTLNGYKGLAEFIIRFYDKKNLNQIPKDLPVLFVSGAEDPVGEWSAGVERSVASLKEVGMTNIECKLYPEDRHEILNEVDREQVYEDLYNWLMRFAKAE
ncbi:MAG: lysophospholipase [Lachnospiraceae bacterium]|nr:lysophospholipase [Lachnospiraceae bacterium]